MFYVFHNFYNSIYYIRDLMNHANEYEDDEQQLQQCGGLGHNRRRHNKSQQIYGIFDQGNQMAYSQKYQTQYQMFAAGNYSKFKSGQTIDTYSSQLQINIPKGKRKAQRDRKLKQNEIDPLVQPEVGQFSLESFLNQVSQNKFLEEIQQQINEQQSSAEENKKKVKLVGLNDNIKDKLKLIKLGESDDEEIITFEDYFSKKEKQLKTPKKTAEERQKQKDFIEGFGKGFKMMQNMGFKATKGLGKDQSGILQPVLAVKKTAFTAKDSLKGNIKKDSDQDQTGSDAQDESKKKTSEEIFNYRSKDPKINNFLLDLKNQYQKLQSRLFFFQKETDSFNKQLEISSNLKLEKQNKLNLLKNQVQQLSAISENFQACTKYPHLAISYKIDMLFAKRTYESLKSMSITQLLSNFDHMLTNLKANLKDFYLAKQKESMKQYTQVTSFQAKMNKVFMIDLTQDNAVAVTSISNQDIQKLNKIIEINIQDTAVAKLKAYFRSLKHIGQNKIYQIIELVGSIKRHDENGIVSQKLVCQYIYPLMQNYFHQLDLKNLYEQYKQNSQKKLMLPHLVIFPWFVAIKPTSINLQILIGKLVSICWTLNDNFFYELIQPWMKFFNDKLQAYLINFYIAPRLYNQMENFKLSRGLSENKSKLNAMKLFTSILEKETIEEIMRDTIILDIVQTYRTYVKQGKQNKSDIQIWLNRWRRQIDKISLHFFEIQMRNYGITI